MPFREAEDRDAPRQPGLPAQAGCARAATAQASHRRPIMRRTH